MPLPPISFSAPSSARSDAAQTLGNVRFGDNHVGAGLKLPPWLMGVVAVAAVIGLFVWLRRKK